MKSLFKFFREGPGGAPRDLETIRRSFLRKFIGFDNRSSAPYLSGDTFKYLSDLIFEGKSINFSKDLGTTSKESPIIFTQGWPVSSAAKELANFCAHGNSFPNASLIIHNCDEIPSHDQMMTLAGSFRKVYSVNWLGDPKIITPLPIGLENRDKRRNGVPGDYAKAIRKGLLSFEQRDINFLVCFSMHTNRAEREEAMRYAINTPGCHVVTDPITPKQYRKLLLRSKFVISPPGNGPDCHRTWEAMYLGAIPVVKKTSWPFQHKDLPVIQLENWVGLENYLEWALPENNSDWKNIHYWFER
jgi:hypothetical protein